MRYNLVDYNECEPIEVCPKLLENIIAYNDKSLVARFSMCTCVNLKLKAIPKYNLGTLEGVPKFVPRWWRVEQ